MIRALRLFLLPIGAVLLLGAGSPDLDALIARYERFSESFPMEAGRSDPSHSPQGWPVETPAGMAARKAELRAIDKALAALPDAALASEDRRNRDFLRQIIGWRVEGIDLDERRFAFVAHEGFYNTPYYAARSVEVRGDADGRAWIARLRGVLAILPSSAPISSAVSPRAGPSRRGWSTSRWRCCAPRSRGPWRRTHCSRR